MPASSFSSLRRSALLAAAPIVAAGAFAASPPSAAVAAPVEEQEICQYSFDQFWRRLPVTLSGELFNVTTNQPIALGASVAPGHQVQLRTASFTAELPKWILTFGFESEFLPLGAGETPISGWVAFEATNTQQGVQPPMPFSTIARSNIVAPGGIVDEVTSTFPIDPAGVNVPTWTATGGPIEVRQAIGTKMGAIPAGRDGALIEVNGSLFAETTLGGGASVTRLYLDCTVGDQLQEGAAHSDRTPQAIGGAVRAPNYDGSVEGGPSAGPLAEPVDFSVVDRSLPRAAAGQPATLDATTVDLRLTAAQRAAWLGSGTTAEISGSVSLEAERGTPASQSRPVATTDVSVPASGGLDLSLEVGDSTWTPSGSRGVDVRSADTIALVARVGGTDRTLRLQRSAASTSLRATAYPFAFVLGPDPRTRFEDTTPKAITPTNPPALGGPKGFAPPPVKQPKRTTVKVASTSLKRSKGKVKVRLTNLSKTATTAGKFKLVTTSKYRVGKSKKARAITLVASKAFSLKKGRSTTYTVKLSKDATALLKTRKSVKAKLTVTPSNAKTQKTVTRTLTVKR